MSSPSDEDIINAILLREGGYVDHHADRGSATKFGVTMATLADWRGHSVTKDDVKALTEAEARSIYREEYVLEPGFHAIENLQLRGLLVDSAVNHGVTGAIKMLQRALGVKVDGIFGKVTLGALNALDAPAAYRRMCAERVRFYGRLISADHSQAVFAAGWCNRVAEFIEEAA